MLVYLSLGSNIGIRDEHLFEGLKALWQHPCIHDFQLAPFYESTPVGEVIQRNFLNTCCCFQTSLSPNLFFL